MSLWLYVAGERTGADIKIGHTTQATIRSRLKGVNGEANDHTYVLLAAVRGDGKDERLMREPFRPVTTKGARREYVHPDPEAVGYAAWLRAQWFAAVDIDARDADYPHEHADLWLPGPGRCILPPPIDDTKLVQDYDTVDGPLNGTPWAWMPNPKASFQDYFTPAEIVNAARTAMGGIDLDPASHWAANRVHKIPEWYTTTRSAFDNPWFGRVWLNPPYGNNEPWFAEIERWVGKGDVTQLCMLSPMWAFTTNIARPVMETATAMILLSPTPKFWGNANPDRVGANHPHAIVYIGDRVAEFTAAFRPFGMAMTPSFADEFVPDLAEGVTA